MGKQKEEKERFIHEAKAASALQHNNVSTIHEIDETNDGQMFICMDYYEGETLKDKIQSGPVKLDEAIDTAIQVAEGLKEAHGKNILWYDNLRDDDRFKAILAKEKERYEFLLKKYGNEN